MTDLTAHLHDVPILLFDDECRVCRRLAAWVTRAALRGSNGALVVRPIGNDPDELRQLDPNLDIWEAYATIHVLMPDGSMKLGGEAIAQVLRSLPNTRWFSGLFGWRVLGIRPFQQLLNVAYLILADVRPLLGCESCGTKSAWVRSIRWLMSLPKMLSGKAVRARTTPRFTPRANTAPRAPSAAT